MQQSSEVVLKPIFDGEYFISSDGVLIRKNGRKLKPFKTKQSFGYEGAYAYKIRFGGKNTTRMAHSLVAEAFGLNHNTYNHGRNKPSKKIKFKDGNKENFSVSNIIPIAKKRVVKVKRFNHADTVECCIEKIQSSYTLNSKHRIRIDNELIVEYLNGNNDSIYKLYDHYKKEWASHLDCYIRKYGKKKIRRKSVKIELTADDFIQEGFIKITSAIQRFKYSGGSFNMWSKKVMINTFRSYLRKETEKTECIKKRFDYDAIWNSL